MAGTDHGAARGVIGPEHALLLINILGGGDVLAGILDRASLQRRLGAATAAMILCGGASSFISLNHQFLVEGIQVMTIAALICVVSQAHRLSWLRLLAGIVIGSAAIATLAKTTSIAFIFPLIAYIIVARRLTRREPRPPIRSIDYWLALGALALAAICAGWYTLHRVAIMAHVREAMEGEDCPALWIEQALLRQAELLVQRTSARPFATSAACGHYPGRFCHWSR